MTDIESRAKQLFSSPALQQKWLEATQQLMSSGKHLLAKKITKLDKPRSH